MKTPLLLALCASALISTPAFADEPNPLHAKIRDIEERMRAAKEQGRTDDLRELAGQANRLRAEIDGRESKGKGAPAANLEALKHKIEELRKAGKTEDAEELERHLRAAAEKQGGHPFKEAGSDAERRQHAMKAIKHLHAAGLHEPAERIAQLLQEPGKGPESPGPGHREKVRARTPEGGGPREGIEPTQQAIHELQEQISKLAHAVEELREQAGRKRADGEKRKE